MTGRISEQQLSRRAVSSILDNKKKIEKYSDELASGLKVRDPGDSNYSGAISQYNETLNRLDQYKSAAAQTKNALQYQDDIMNQMNELLTRTKEIATQGANETNSPTSRSQLANEVFALRDQMVNLANTTFQGRYIYGGADDDDPPFDQGTPYTNNAGGPSAIRYVFDAEAGTSATRSVQVADGVNVQINTSGQNLFATAIGSAEKLGRALLGYDTTLTAGVPDGGGAAYVFPQDFSTQTANIQATIDSLNTVRETIVIPERNRLGGELTRIDNGAAIIEIIKANTQEIVASLQKVDEADAATKLSLTQTALQASYNITAKTLNLTILNYL